MSAGNKEAVRAAKLPKDPLFIPADPYPTVHIPEQTGRTLQHHL
jgi:hypothetical protein